MANSAYASFSSRDPIFVTNGNGRLMTNHLGENTVSISESIPASTSAYSEVRAPRSSACLLNRALMFRQNIEVTGSWISATGLALRSSSDL